MILKVFIGLLIFANFLFWSNSGEVKDLQVNHTPLIKGVKDIKINNTTFKQEVYYGVPGLYNLKDQLDFLKIKLGEKDRVVMVPNPQLGVGGKIEITRANSITLIDGKTQKTFSTWAQTVGEFLEDEKITLGKTDKLEPEAESLLSQDAKIKITRIGIKGEKSTQQIDFKTITKIDPNKDVCWQDVTQVGKEGILTKFFKVTYENGDEVARIKIKEEVTVVPLDKIITKGNKIISYGQGKATWYRWRAGEAAHNTLPRDTMVKVTNLVNGKSTIVKITDRGIHRSDVVIDLDVGSFEKLAPRSQGIAQVKLEKAC